MSTTDWIKEFLPSARMRSEGTVVGFVCLSVTINLTSRVFVRLTKYTIYLTGNEGQKICGVFCSVAELQREKANMQIHNGQDNPRALCTSETPEDATQGVYHLSHAI